MRIEGARRASNNVGNTVNTNTASKADSFILYETEQQLKYY